MAASCPGGRAGGDRRGLHGRAAPHGVVVLVIWVLVGGALLAGNERSRIVTSPDGITCVPFLGRTRRYRWSAINGFGVERVPGGRYGGPVVAAILPDRIVLLMPTLRRDGARESVQRACDALNAELEGSRGGRSSA